MLHTKIGLFSDFLSDTQPNSFGTVFPPCPLSHLVHASLHQHQFVKNLHLSGIGEARVRNLRPHIECSGFRGQTQELERLTEQYCNASWLTHYPLPIAHYPLPIAYCLLPIAYCLLPTFISQLRYL
jgi:hypothetical protein